MARKSDGGDDDHRGIPRDGRRTLPSTRRRRRRRAPGPGEAKQVFLDVVRERHPDGLAVPYNGAAIIRQVELQWASACARLLGRKIAFPSSRSCAHYLKELPHKESRRPSGDIVIDGGDF